MSCGIIKTWQQNIASILQHVAAIRGKIVGTDSVGTASLQWVNGSTLVVEQNSYRSVMVTNADQAENGQVNGSILVPGQTISLTWPYGVITPEITIVGTSGGVHVALMSW